MDPIPRPAPPMDSTDPASPRDAATTVALRSRFTRLLAAAIAVPTLLFAGIQLRSDYLTAQAHLQAQLRLATRLAAVSVDQFTRSHVAAVALVADGAGRHGDLPDLSALRARFPALLTALVADADGAIRAVEPAARAVGATNRQVADRDYFRVPAATLRPYVSNGFVGRGLGNEPLVAVSAPIVADGQFAGIVEGSIPIDTFAWLRANALRSRGQELLIIDREGQVVHASEGLPYRFLQSVHGAPFLQGEEGLDGVSEAVLARGVLRDGSDAWVAWSELPSGWRVALFAPQRTVLSALAQQAASMGGLLVIAVAGALLVAGWQMRRLGRATAVVLDALRGMATDGRAAATRLADVPPELQPVARSIAELSQRLEGANAGLRQALERERALAASLREMVDVREREVAERTAELRVANIELERLSRTDPLTGALNVRGFRSHCDGFVDSAGALHAPMAVLAFDVDHFKSYNDHYGHPAGDRVLRRVAGAAQAALRDEGDRVARVGGEEFVVLLPQAGAAAAHAVAERMRHAVADLGIRHEATAGGRLSISLGVVVADAGELLEAVLQQADALLYRAKAEGRDRIAM